MTDAKPKLDGKYQAPLLEWIAAGIGLLLTLTVLGVIGSEALNSESEQLPAISVKMTGISSSAAGYVVAFEAVNETGDTAAAAEIEATLKRDDTIVATSKATLDYVPGHSKAKGGVFFVKYPRRHKLELRALGFQIP